MRTVLVGNNLLACNVMDYLIQRGDMVGCIAEGKDCVKEDVGWERNFQHESEGLRVMSGNINTWFKHMKVLDLDLICGVRGVNRVSKDVLKLPRLGVTNIHYGMLPRYGGCDTIPHAILNGEKEIGVTMHFMSPDFDTGDILEQRAIDISQGERYCNIGRRVIPVRGMTAFEAYQQANKVGFDVFKHVYHLLVNGGTKAHPQRGKPLYYRRGEICYDTNLVDIEGETDETIARHIRAFTYPPKNSTPYGLYRGKVLELKLEDTK